jgi:hypothetical protein
MKSTAITLAITLLAAPALAQSIPKPAAPAHTIDMTQSVPGDDGKPMIGPDGKPDTLGHAVARVLMGLPDPHATLQQLLDRAALAKRIEDSAKVELTAPEVALIEKEVVDGYQKPGVVAAVVGVIDPAQHAGEIKP